MRLVLVRKLQRFIGFDIGLAQCHCKHLKILARMLSRSYGRQVLKHIIGAIFYKF